MAPQSALEIYQDLTTAGKAFEKNEAGAREALIEHSRALIASLEIPSEFLQRTFWAEVSLSLFLLKEEKYKTRKQMDTRCNCTIANMNSYLARPICNHSPWHGRQALPTSKGCRRGRD